MDGLMDDQDDRPRNEQVESVDATEAEQEKRIVARKHMKELFTDLASLGNLELSVQGTFNGPDYV